MLYSNRDSHTEYLPHLDTSCSLFCARGEACGICKWFMSWRHVQCPFLARFCSCGETNDNWKWSLHFQNRTYLTECISYFMPHNSRAWQTSPIFVMCITTSWVKHFVINDTPVIFKNWSVSVSHGLLGSCRKLEECQICLVFSEAKATSENHLFALQHKTQVRRGVKAPLHAVFGTRHGSVWISDRSTSDEEILGQVGSRSWWRRLIP